VKRFTRLVPVAVPARNPQLSWDIYGKYDEIWGSINGGSPITGWFIKIYFMGNPIYKWMIWG